MVPAPQATGADTDSGDTGGQTAVVTRPLRPTGKRSRRGAVTDAGRQRRRRRRRAPRPLGRKDDAGKAKPKTAKKAKPTGRRATRSRSSGTTCKQVVAELRKVIWPNRKQMVSYTTVVLVFLAFMVTLIGLVDLGLAKLVMLVFG